MGSILWKIDTCLWNIYFSHIIINNDLSISFYNLGIDPLWGLTQDVIYWVGIDNLAFVHYCKTELGYSSDRQEWISH